METELARRQRERKNILKRNQNEEEEKERGSCELLCTPAPRAGRRRGHGSDEDPGEVGQQPQVLKTTFEAAVQALR